MSKDLKKLGEVPARQAMQYTIERAKKALEWLKETNKELEETRVENKAKLCDRKRILTDVLAVYISTLAERGGSGHSLIKSFEPHDFTKKFVSLPVVKNCCLNRNNRSAHESKTYGNFISPDEILSSNLEVWLSEVEYFVCMVGQLKVLNKCS